MSPLERTTLERSSFLDRQVHLFGSLKEQVSTQKEYFHLSGGLDVFYSNDAYLNQHGPRGIVQRRQQIKDEDIGIFDRFSSLITTLWESQDATKQAQAEFLLKRLTAVTRSHYIDSALSPKLREEERYPDNILYDEDSLANLADSLFLGDQKTEEVANFSPVTPCGPVAGNKVVLGKNQ